MTLDVVSEQPQEVHGEGSTEVATDTVDKNSEAELFSKLSSHQLSNNGTYTMCSYCSLLQLLYKYTNHTAGIYM